MDIPESKESVSEVKESDSRHYRISENEKARLKRMFRAAGSNVVDNANMDTQDPGSISTHSRSSSSDSNSSEDYSFDKTTFPFFGLFTEAVRQVESSIVFLNGLSDNVIGSTLGASFLGIFLRRTSYWFFLSFTSMIF